MKCCVKEIMADCFIIKETKSSNINDNLKNQVYNFILDKISLRFRIERKKIIIKRNRYGKPYLENFDNFYFNISYTYKAAIVIFSEVDVGIDIEYINNYKENIVKRFFLNREKLYVLNARDNCRKEIRFYEIWTKKEAYVKWRGKGFSIPINSFSVLDVELSKFFTTINIEEYIVSIFMKK